MQEIPLKVVHESGNVVYDEKVPATDAASVDIPKDGRTGEYVLFLGIDDKGGKVIAPLTDLPKEVYPGTYWLFPNGKTVTYYVGIANMPGDEFQLGKFRGDAWLEDMDKQPLASYLGAPSHTTPDPEGLTAALPKNGAWLIINTRSAFTPNYFQPAEPQYPALLSITPELFFQPSDNALSIVNDPVWFWPEESFKKRIRSDRKSELDFEL